jgi:hypothetical protein
MRLASLLFLCLLPLSQAQVYSPVVLKAGQVDATNLMQAGARTPRKKAQAIWRFFLTDGRFVKPGFCCHIAGWA